MGDATRPLVLGYIRSIGMAPRDLRLATSRLHLFAGEEGFALGSVFVDDSSNEAAVTAALYEAIRREEPRAVLVTGWRPRVVFHDAASVALRIEMQQRGHSRPEQRPEPRGTAPQDGRPAFGPPRPLSHPLADG